MRRYPWHLCFLWVLLAAPSLAPDRSALEAGAGQTLGDTIAELRRSIREAPHSPASRTTRDNLIALLIADHRYNEALSEYRCQLALRQPSAEPDLKLLELLLKTGAYGELIRLTGRAPANGRNLMYDEKLFELRIQAFLAQGQYRRAREALDQWLGMHAAEGLAISRFEPHVRSLQQVRRYLVTLERLHGARGKPLFTASVPDSFSRWSRRNDVPIIFYQLIPADGPAPSIEEIPLRQLLEDMNYGFRYLSGGRFSLAFRGIERLYMKASDFDPSDAHASVFSSRVYVHTHAPIYKSAGRAFVVLVDSRRSAEGQAAYMGDGIIHIAADKLRSVTLMHEILHGLGATHQEPIALAAHGFRFDPLDRGLMSFDKGELRDFGLEEKNRVLLDWPAVDAVKLPDQESELSTLNLHTQLARRR